MNDNLTSADFFEQMYQKNTDPWHFASSHYEMRRYQSIYNALAHQRYQNTFEPGCSIGVFTEKLASLSDSVHAIDISPTATAIARVRCRHLTNVVINCQSLINWCSDEQRIKPDLIVLSEIGYYFKDVDLKQLVIKLLDTGIASTTLLVAHWLGTSTDHHLSGDEVHAIIQSIDGLEREYSTRHTHFRLDRWIKR